MSSNSVSKPLIGINGDYRPTKADQKNAGALSWYNAGYFDSVTASGGVPMLLPPYASDEALRRVLAMLDGVDLSG